MKTLTVNRQSTSNTKSLLKFLDEVKVGETLEIICEESFFKFDRFIKDEDVSTQLWYQVDKAWIFFA